MLTGGGGGSGSSLGGFSAPADGLPSAAFRWPRRFATSTALSNAPTTSAYGSPVRFVATVSAARPLVAGTVSFAADGQTIAGCGAQPVARNDVTGRMEASCTTAALRAGLRPVVARYTGYTNDDAVRGASTSPTVAHVVTRAASKVTVSCSPNPVVYPDSVQCTATVTGPTTAPTGKVTWTSSGLGGFTFVSCSLSGGTCSVAYRPAATDVRLTGGITIRATYLGDNNHRETANVTTLAVRR